MAQRALTVRPGYREAVEWLVYNDDCTWIWDDEPIISVAAIEAGCIKRSLLVNHTIGSRWQFSAERVYSRCRERQETQLRKPINLSTRNGSSAASRQAVIRSGI